MLCKPCTVNPIMPSAPFSKEQGLEGVRGRWLGSSPTMLCEPCTINPIMPSALFSKEQGLGKGQ